MSYTPQSAMGGMRREGAMATRPTLCVELFEVSFSSASSSEKWLRL
jgi:hypothetical protein